MKNKKALPETIFGIETSLITILLWPFTALIVFLVVMLGVVLPKVNEINDMNAKTLELVAKKNSVVEKKNYIKSVDQSTLKNDMVLLNNSLLKEKNWYVLMNVVNKVAQKSGFQIDSFLVTPGKVTNNTADQKKTSTEMVAKIPVTLTLTGPKDAYLDFLLALEKTLPLLVVDQFVMKITGEAVELNLVVSSYFMSSKDTVVGNLSLADLTLKPEESAVLKTLTQYQNVLENENKQTVPKQFVRYNRDNPFSL